MAEYSKPEGIRFTFEGVKTNSSADSMPRGKFPYAQNIRAYGDNSVQSRPQLTSVYAFTGTGPVLSLDPTLGIYKAGGSLIHTGTTIDSGYSAVGASLVPFRPNASPNAWEYVFDSVKSSKVLPSGPTVQKIGIAEPQAACDASLLSYRSVILSPNPGYISTGTATVGSNGTRLTETVTAVLSDPAFLFLYSLGVTNASPWSRGMAVTIGGTSFIVLDVFQRQDTPIKIAAIYYFLGNTGRCIIVPQGMSTGGEEQSIYAQDLLTSLRRGSLITLSGLTEICYVWSVTEGPDGTICIETSTVNNHSVGQTIVMPAAIQILGGIPTVGQTATQGMFMFTVNTGIGAIQSSPGFFPSDFFVQSFSSFQPSDLLHFSLHLDAPQNLIEMKILFDVGDGSFTRDFYYYTVRQNDFTAAVQNTLTQLGAAQLVEQRATIDESLATETRNQGRLSSGAQADPGAQQWSEITFPVSDMTRVGTDETKTLQNVNAVKFLFNVSGTLTPFIAPLTLMGGFSPDVGSTGNPYRYRIRPRSSVTGAKGNPSPPMRYGINPRRTETQVFVPLSHTDNQADTWDIFREGGTLDKPRLIGYMPIGTSQFFVDNYADDAVAQNEALELDNYEPFPTIEKPFGAIITAAAGTIAVARFTSGSVSQANAVAGVLLPGNLVQIGSANVYTLWTRPTFLRSSGFQYYFLFQFVENIGNPSLNSALTITEPLIANQLLPYVWGPDVNGVLFAVGDFYRAGSVSHTKPQNPDAGLDAVDELCPPTEPLQNGVVMDGLSFVASPNRWWAGHTSQDEAGNLKYNWIEVPVGSGLAAPFAICTDGRYIYFVDKYGIKRHANGPGESVTDADLFNLFPHEGIGGKDVTYNQQTFYAPDYRYALSFRLAVVNGWLYFDYLDSTATYRTLVMNTRNLAWQGTDVYGIPVSPISIHAGVTLPGYPASVGPAPQQLYAGDAIGGIWSEVTTPVRGVGEGIVVDISTKEEMPNVRAQSMWGDAALDVFAPGSQMTIQTIFLGAAVGTPTIIPGNQTNRTPGLTVSVGGQFLAHSMGLQIFWVDTGTTSVLYSWTPSFVPQPEDFTDRFDDWDDCGTPGAKFIQGVMIEADTANIPKTFAVRSSEDQSLNTLLEMPATFNGQGMQAFSLATPFIAHLVRLEPQDTVVCRKFRAKFIFEPCPEAAENWVTQGTSYGYTGFLHAQRVIFAYRATTPVTLTITASDGVSPSVVTLPSTAGAYKKLEFILTPNKGRLYSYQGQSSAPWRPYVDDCVVFVKPWNSAGAYENKPLIGDPHGNQATI